MYRDEQKKFDIRIIERNLAEGIITPQEYEEYLKNLPDVSSNIDHDYTFILDKDNFPEKEDH
ncbi:MAG: hypothetical protein N3A64_00600 [Desulfobacterota bacterium]|nr:hypothetical protein [Thermodesulfobacteriota bacterium]